ncbi:TonB-dependent receptor plug domain-containing protein [Aeromonas sp. R3-1]|uniref:TonB-dependent receptor plug domain-containing protein n=1 Tax=Aeromonas sp. R3-1 TaxID=3138463 RepID=UPI0034A33390
MQLQPDVSRLNPTLLSLGLCALPGLAQAEAPKANETMVITATQTKHTELSAPANVSVITRVDLDKRSVMDLTDTLKTVPGVSFIPSTPNGRYEIKLRGMGGKYALILLNGHRLNAREVMEDNDGNDFDIASIPVAAIERIEILRGPASSLYGSDAMAGVINIITRTPGNKTEGSLGYDYRNITSGKGGDLYKGSGYLSGALVDDKLFRSLMVEKYNRDAWQSGSTWVENTSC